MKKIACIVLALFAMGGLRAQVLEGAAAEQEVSGAKLVWKDESNGEIKFVRFYPDRAPAASEHLKVMRESASFRQQDAFVAVKEEADELGQAHIRYAQQYQGIPVEAGMMIAHLSGGKLLAFNGEYFRINPPATSPAVTEAAAFQAARSFVGASTYMWELAEEEQHLKEINNDPSATWLKGGELVYAPVNGDFQPENFRLTWKFDIYASEPLSRQLIYVDALTNQVIWTVDMIHDTEVPGHAHTKYSGQQNIQVDSIAPGQFRLRESGRGNGIETYDMQRGTSYGNAIDFTDTDNVWNNVDSLQNEAATDAHWGAEMTYDYFLFHHNRNSYDGNGAKMRSYVHYNLNYVNAFWDGQRMTYGDGNGIGITALTALDIVGHEFSHGVTGNTAGLIYQYESGALNESFSDIFGTAIEFYARPGNANWKIGEDIYSSGTGFRDMQDPNAQTDPDTYLGKYWYGGTGDNGGVHTNSGVQNYWFFLLTNGGSGTNDNLDQFSVAGIGIQKSAKIAYRNLSVYLTSSSDYEDARFYAIQSAIDLFGDCSHEMVQTMNAWYAVGVGGPYSTVPFADFTSDLDTFCTAPTTVEFQNLSTGAATCFWQFGDGAVSTQINPTHTYTANGNYEVTLIITGCTNQADTLVRSGMIYIDPDQPCLVVMPQNQTNAMETGCEGKLMDSGGNGNYLNSNNSVLTIAPTNANKVTLNFLSFDFVVGGDYIAIYDGPSTSSPLIGNYAGNSLPNGGTITSTGGAITIKETSNSLNNASGFELTWNCEVLTDVEDGLQDEALVVYPVPAHERIFVKGLTGSAKIQLVDLQGRVMQALDAEGNIAELNISSFAAGLYFVKIEMNDRIEIRKVVIE